VSVVSRYIEDRVLSKTAWGKLLSARRFRLFASHLLISAAAVGGVVAIVLFVWYPRPLFSLQGAPIILTLVAFVDIVVGPLLTLIVGSPKKSRRSLVRDLAIIGTVQFAALIYGAHSLFIARPAFIVFNTDRFDVVVANELARNESLTYRDARFASAPMLGPVWAIARPADSLDERNRMLFSTAVEGGPDIKDFPALYEAWPPERRIDEARLKPVDELMVASSDGNQAVVHAMRRSGLQQSELGYVPLVGREKIGVVILDRNTLKVVYSTDVRPNY
jgi:hypothetical protein